MEGASTLSAKGAIVYHAMKESTWFNTNNKMKSAPEMIDCQGFVKQKHGETLKGGKLKGL